MSLYGITKHTVAAAMDEVEEALMRRPEGTEIHTVTIITNGQHGGSDVIIEGVNGGPGPWRDEYGKFTDLEDFTITKEVK